MKKTALSQKTSLNAFAAVRGESDKGRISLEEEKALVRQWRENHDETAIARLLEIYEPLLKKISRPSPHESRSELYNQACLGFLEGTRRYDLSSEARLGTYAQIEAQAHVRHFRSKSRVTQTRPSQLDRQDKILLDHYTRLMSEHNGRSGNRPLTQQERNVLSQKLGKPLCEVEELLSRYFGPAFSLDQTISPGDGDETTYLDLQTGTANDPFYETARMSDLDFLEKAIEEAGLTAREREVIGHRYLAGLYLADEIRPQKDVAGKLGLSVQAVSEFERKALEKMRAYAKEILGSQERSKASAKPGSAARSLDP